MISDRIYNPLPTHLRIFHIERETALCKYDEIMYRKTYLYQKINGQQTTALSNQYFHMIYITENGHAIHYCSFLHLALFCIIFF